MTPEMAFECLLVTPDPAVFSTMGELLQDFSISTKACPDTSNAARLLAEGSADLIIIDLDAKNASEFLEQAAAAPIRQKPTVLAVSGREDTGAYVHVVLRKPVDRDSGLTSLKAAYSRMLRDYRQHTRFAVMSPVVVKDENGRSVQVTVTNIGEGGVGLTSMETIRVGSTLNFRLCLTGLENEISIQARVLWTRAYGAFGCEFMHLPAFDHQLLRAWLESRYRIKKPLRPV
jgi:CheY-like chemotaxis protein